MHITCLTAIAAMEVLQILQTAGLLARQDFHLAGPMLPDPPIIVIIHVGIPCQVICQIGNIADATVVRS